MEHVLGLIRPILSALILVGALVGCSSSGTDTVVEALIDDVLPGGNDDGGEGPNLAETITRAQIEAADVAMLRIEEGISPERRLMVAFRQSGDQVTYVLRGNRRLVLVGGLIQSTAGFGDNLEPIGIREGDPIAAPQPIETWPDRVTRDYTVSDRGPGEATAFTCAFFLGEVARIEIVGLSHEVQAVNEVCESDNKVRFVNRHLVQPDNGFIWQSVQWTGPNQRALKYEVLEPLD